MSDVEASGGWDRVAARLLGGPATIAVAVVVAAALATWLPHYLTWPWWPDLDAYATIAQSWEAGRRPYRDVLLFNFPGQVELFWLLGKATGWGRTAPIYAVDAAALVGLGIALVAWSRRRAGSALPGMMGFAAVVHEYLMLDYSLVAQRDWHGPLLAVVAILLVQTFPGLSGRVASAAAFAIGFAIRPHVVLFLPALALAIAEASRRPGEPRRRAVRPLIEWSLAFAAAILIAFAPLIASGLLDDFVRSVEMTRYGTGYAKRTVGEAFLALARPFRSPRFDVVLAGVLALPWFAPRQRCRTAWPWLVAGLAAVIYGPLHPVPHAYLVLPWELLWGVNVAVLAMLVMALPAAPRWRLLMLVTLLVAAMPGVPRYCSLSATFQGLEDLARPGTPAVAPIGSDGRFRPTRRPGAAYVWDDYRRTLDFLRGHTPSGTLVANLLRNPPFPAINGASGRLSTIPAESGILWISAIEPGRVGRFADDLAHAPPGSLVVWVPGEVAYEPKLQLEPLAEAVRRHYQPAARFGEIEVWTRAGVSPTRPGRSITRPDPAPGRTARRVAPRPAPPPRRSPRG